MKLGDLFVDLGVTGNEKTVGALTGMRKGMSEVSSVSLEAKAAILGALYALQRMFSESGKQGQSLNQFNQLLGVSAQTLQEYQYAARQVGVSNAEMENSFKGIQSQMTKTLLNGDAPKGLARVAELTGKIGKNEILEWQKAPEKLLQRLQQYAQLEKNPGLRNETLKSFSGITDGIIAGMKQNIFRPDVFAKAPKYTDKEIQSLQRADTAWSNLGTTIEMAFGKFNAKHGEKLVSDISKLVPEVLKLVTAFTQLAEKAKAFELLSTIFKGWSMIFKEIGDVINDVNALMDAMDHPQKPGEGNLPKKIEFKDPSKATLGSDFAAIVDLLSLVFTGHKSTPNPNAPTVVPGANGQPYRILAPTLPRGPGSDAKAPQGAGTDASGNTYNTVVNQTQTFTGSGATPADAAKAQSRAAKDAFQTSPARGRGN